MKKDDILLIVEDDKKINSFLSIILNDNQYESLQSYTGKEAISMAATYNPALILLDLNLPDIDGLEVLRRIREWSDTPIIVISARQGEGEKVEALDAGANDYVTKPFGNDELLARIRSAIRVHQRLKTSNANIAFETGTLRIDYEKRIVQVDGVRVHITPLEYKILLLLSQNAGKVLTHDQIINKLWGPYSSDSQILRVNVANIRRKIERNPADPQYILTEIGVGYRMAEPN